MKKIILWSGFLFSITILFGCSSSEHIDTVKDGILDFNKSLTVGEALDSYKYFTSTKWKNEESERGRIQVSFMGYLSQKDITLPSISNPFFGIIFRVNKDKSFNILFMYIMWTIKNGDMISVPFMVDTYSGLIDKKEILTAIYGNNEILSSYFQKNKLNGPATLFTGDGHPKEITLKDGIQVGTTTTLAAAKELVKNDE